MTMISLTDMKCATMDAIVLFVSNIFELPNLVARGCTDCFSFALLRSVAVGAVASSPPGARS